MTSHNEPTIYINFENIPIEKMDAEIIPSKLNEIFYKLMNDEGYFDLERLRTFIDRQRLNLLSNLDKFPQEALSSIIIRDFLYGNNEADVSNIVCKLLKTKMIL